MEAKKRGWLLSSVSFPCSAKIVGISLVSLASFALVPISRAADDTREPAAKAERNDHQWPAWRGPLIAELTKELKAADEAVAQSPTSVEALSRRGDCHLFLGQFPEAVADFEKMIALDPAQDAPHWRLGIAYYFASQFGKSARQFEKYHAYDGHDRENGIWKFLAQAKGDGLEKARDDMLTYTQFDREPFPELYEMFAGKRTTDEVFAEIDKKGLSNKPMVVFFGNYYGGLNEALLGHRDHALSLLRLAVDNPKSEPAGYMWQVARLQWEKVVAEGKAKD